MKGLIVSFAEQCVLVICDAVGVAESLLSLPVAIKEYVTRVIGSLMTL